MTAQPVLAFAWNAAVGIPMFIVGLIVLAAMWLFGQPKKEQGKRRVVPNPSGERREPTFGGEGEAIDEPSFNARDDFHIAVYLKPDYQEAHVNLAESLKLLDDDSGARREYLSAIKMDPTRAGLAYARYAELVRNPKERSELLGLASWADSLHKECRASNSTSLLESQGCSVAMQAETTHFADTGSYAGIETVAATAASAPDCQSLAVDDILGPKDGLPDIPEIAP